MTNPSPTDLIERLRKREITPSMYGGFDLMNPDGPDAADRIESLLADRAKLEEALRSLIAANERTPMHLRMPYEIEPTENAKRALHG